MKLSMWSAPSLKFVELHDGLPFVVVGLALDDEAAFTVDDVADASGGGVAVHPVDRLLFPVHVLEGQAAVVEEKRGRLVGVEGQLVVRGLAVVFVAPASAEAHDALGQQFGIAERPAAHVELVRSLVADVAIAEGPLPVPVVVELLPMHGLHAARTRPQLEVHVHILRLATGVAEHALDRPSFGSTGAATLPMDSRAL